MSIFENLRTEKQYKAATGLDMKEFENLYLYFKNYYEPKKASPYPEVPQPVLTDKREALFFILHYLKAYPTLENMGLYFGFDVRTVSDYIKILKGCLKAALKEAGSVPPTLFKGQEEHDKAFEGIRELFIDGTEIPVNRSQNNDYQRFTYSGKKKANTQKAMVVSCASKVIRYIGMLWNGKTHDKKIFDHEMGEFDWSGKIRHVDMGYKGMENDGKGGMVFIPHKKPRNGELDSEQKEENRFFSSIRVTVENTIGGLKRYDILKIKNRFHYIKKTYDSLQLCAGLWNFRFLST